MNATAAGQRAAPRYITEPIGELQDEQMNSAEHILGFGKAEFGHQSSLPWIFINCELVLITPLSNSHDGQLSDSEEFYL
jgi:hypothetical protein